MQLRRRKETDPSTQNTTGTCCTHASDIAHSTGYGARTILPEPSPPTQQASAFAIQQLPPRPPHSLATMTTRAMPSSLGVRSRRRDLARCGSGSSVNPSLASAEKLWALPWGLSTEGEERTLNSTGAGSSSENTAMTCREGRRVAVSCGCWGCRCY